MTFPQSSYHFQFVPKPTTVPQDANWAVTKSSLWVASTPVPTATMKFPQSSTYHQFVSKPTILPPAPVPQYANCSCACIRRQNNESQSGVYKILGFNSTTASLVYCDMETDGGGWTVFQRRQDGSVDFYRDWNDYKNGFGNARGEFWLGLDILHWLLSLSDNGNRLQVDLGDADGERRYAEYATFSIGDESTKYVLSVSGYSGDAGDSLGPTHSAMKFTTKDQDHDTLDGDNCAVVYRGGWWFKDCHDSGLNGEYNGTADAGIWWKDWKREPLKFSEMKFRSN